MANVLGELFGDIASAIREKTGDAEKMKPAKFPEKISEIETGADVSGVTATAADVLEGKTIVDADGNEVEGSIPVVETSEVELSVQTPSGAIPVGYYANGVALSVAAKSAAVTPTKETQNLADSFYDSITVDPIPEEYQNVSGVTATAEDVVEGKVIVDASGNEVVGTLTTEIKLQDKTITENGEYTADSGFDGLGKVLVDIAASGSSVILKKGDCYGQTHKGSNYSVYHGVGVVPDIIIIGSNYDNYDGTNTDSGLTSLVACAGTNTGIAYRYGFFTRVDGGIAKNEDLLSSIYGASDYYGGYALNVTEKYFTLPKPIKGVDYYWTAISGIL